MRLDDEALFNYREARAAFLDGRISDAEYWFRKNRAEHSLEVFYEVDLPEHVRLVHPLGTVLGRATYAPHLVVYQGVSVGSTVDHERPTFLGPCALLPHSGVIGPVTVGRNVWITAGTIVEARPGKPFSLPDNCVVSRTVSAEPTAGLLDVGFRTDSTTRSVLDTYFPALPERGHSS